MSFAEPHHGSDIFSTARFQSPNFPDASNAQYIAHPFAEQDVTSSSTLDVEIRNSGARVPPAAPSPPSRNFAPAWPASVGYRPTNMAADLGLASHQWLFVDDEINNSPSIADGISPLEERTRRAKGVNFIIQAGILLKIPQLTLATAAVFFHRFYMRYSMVPEKNGIHHYNIAATALFLASKAEETCRKTKDIVIAVARVAQKNAGLIIDEQSKEFWRWKDSILAYEETMLELLTFDVVLESPYTHLYECLKMLDIENRKTLRNVAWAFLNDSCMTTTCLRMPSKDIAVASIYFSAKFTNEKIPDDVDDEPWWAKIDGIPERIVKAIEVMQEFYQENPLKKSDNPYDQSPGNGIADLHKTRLRNESRSPNTRIKAEEEADEEENANAEDVGPSNGSVKHEDEDRRQALNHERIAVVKAKGDDDAALKKLANDPAAHENSASQNIVNGSSSKRLASEVPDIASDSDSKRMRVNDEESEEGEVEE